MIMRSNITLYVIIFIFIMILGFSSLIYEKSIESKYFDLLKKYEIEKIEIYNNGIKKNKILKEKEIINKIKNLLLETNNSWSKQARLYGISLYLEIYFKNGDKIGISVEKDINDHRIHFFYMEPFDHLTFSGEDKDNLFDTLF